ncbi:MAG: kelch motif-containing protein [bacterium]|nr:kelch motif-containing protein [bacterium]
MNHLRLVTFLLPAAPATAQLDWQEIVLANPPAARHESALTIDPEAGLVMFGGSSNSGILGDTWRFSANAWVQLTPQVSPPARVAPRMATDSARYDHAMAYDMARARTVWWRSCRGRGGTW